MKKFYVISYDIADDRKRYRIDKALKNVGIRVQKSVFECILTDAEFIKLKKELERYINMDTDSIRYYFLCKGCTTMIEKVGNTPVLESNDYLII